MYSTVCTVAQAGTVHIEPIRSDQGAFIGAEVRVTKTSRTVRRNSIQGKNWISVKPTLTPPFTFHTNWRCSLDLQMGPERT